MKKVTAWSHFKSIIALPFVVLVVVPFLIQHLSDDWDQIVFGPLTRALSIGIASALGVLGLLLFIGSIDLFIRIGKGTLAPWNPTRNLVVKGLYRHTRNPMIMGVLLILLTEAFLFQSLEILIWATLFLTINQIYFRLKEEPDLVKRFGEEYLEYKQNVPRWIPRGSGWRPEEQISDEK